jgi:GTP-binding protein
MKPIVAIVGRPNVGKSTLFNRLIGHRRAMVDDTPGVTRDRNYAHINRYDKPFILVDTGGFEPVTSDRMLQQMREQSSLAMDEADVILFMMDARSGLTPADAAAGQKTGLLRHQQGGWRPARERIGRILLPGCRAALYHLGGT